MAATSSDSVGGIEKIDNHREELETLADSDLPCDYIAEALIEVASDE